LYDAPEMMFIQFIYDRGSVYDHETRTMLWNPNDGLIISGGISFQSPALVLAHEMAHAAQQLNGLIHYDTEMRNEVLRRFLDQDVLSNYEIRIALELGEPIRLRYDDGSRFPVINVTSFVNMQTSWITLY